MEKESYEEMKQMLLQYENEHNPEKDYEYPKVSLPKWMRGRE